MRPLRNKIPLRCIPDKKLRNYRLYKNDLSKDFNNSCGYCGVHHIYFGELFGFHIDHFAPKSKFPHLKDEYSNLVYACPICNCSKSNDWCGDDEINPVKGNTGYIDPCDPAYNDLFYRDDLGKIYTSEKSLVAEYMHKKLKFSLRRHSIYWMVDELRDKISELTLIHLEIDHLHPYYDDIKKVLKSLLEFQAVYENLQRK